MIPFYHVEQKLLVDYPELPETETQTLLNDVVAGVWARDSEQLFVATSQPHPAIQVFEQAASVDSVATTLPLPPIELVYSPDNGGLLVSAHDGHLIEIDGNTLIWQGDTGHQTCIRDFWFTQTGDQIITACGKVFFLNQQTESAYVYNQTIDRSANLQFDHLHFELTDVSHHPDRSLVAVIEGTDVGAIYGNWRLLSDDYYQPQASYRFGLVEYNGIKYQPEPVVIGFNQPGDTLIIVTRLQGTEEPVMQINRYAVDVLLNNETYP